MTAAGTRRPVTGPLRAWLLAIRPRTLPASAAPVLLGAAMAAHHAGRGGQPLAADLLAACLAVAGLLQVAANLANDLLDARSGVDRDDRLGPVRVTQTGLLSARAVTAGLAVCVLLAVAAGLYAVWQVGWWLLAVGAVCVGGALAYTAGPWPLARHGLGELAAVVFFGPVACTGTFAVLQGSPTAAAWLAGLVCGLHAGAIMAVNNLRDLASDARAGKRTLAVRLGERSARRLAAGLLLAGNLAALPVAAALGRPQVALAVLLVPMSWPLVREMHTTPRSRALNRTLARTGQWELLSAVVVGALVLA